MSLIDEIRYGRAAGKLAAYARAYHVYGPEDTLVVVFELLSEYTPEERAKIAARAVELGADEATITALVQAVGGETIEVVGKAPRRFPWWLLVAGAAVAAAGVAYRHRRRGRRGLGSWGPGSGPRAPSRLPRVRQGPSPYGRPGRLPFNRGDEVFVDAGATRGRGEVVQDFSSRRVVVDLDDGRRVQVPRGRITYRIASVR